MSIVRKSELQDLTRAELTTMAMSHGIKGNISSVEMIDAIADIEAGRVPSHVVFKGGVTSKFFNAVKENSGKVGSGMAIVMAIVGFLIGKSVGVANCIGPVTPTFAPSY